MPVSSRLRYLRRVARSYVGPGASQLSFWHETPTVNPDLSIDKLGPYYMTFSSKADYDATLDSAEIPMLDYHGAIGPQYNPIAIAQFGLGNYNEYSRTNDPDRLRKAALVADWLLANLQPNAQGLKVWNHHFDWEYRTTLRAPWYSGLAQGQGISLLLRAHAATGQDEYLNGALEAFEPMLEEVDRGGVLFTDRVGDPWIEEYIVSPPTHILNGFMWALWGVYDLHLHTGDTRAKDLFERCITTLERNLQSYDTGYWSMYEHSGTRMKMLASPFYHSLHIVQLRVMHLLTGREVFRDFADRWERYAESRLKRSYSLAYKVMFKLWYY